jgi:hypothetical protein
MLDPGTTATGDDREDRWSRDRRRPVVTYARIGAVSPSNDGRIEPRLSRAVVPQVAGARAAASRATPPAPPAARADDAGRLDAATPGLGGRPRRRRALRVVVIAGAIAAIAGIGVIAATYKALVTAPVVDEETPSAIVGPIDLTPGVAGGAADAGPAATQANADDPAADAGSLRAIPLPAATGAPAAANEMPAPAAAAPMPAASEGEAAPARAGEPRPGAPAASGGSASPTPRAPEPAPADAGTDLDRLMNEVDRILASPAPAEAPEGAGPVPSDPDAPMVLQPLPLPPPDGAATLPPPQPLPPPGAAPAWPPPQPPLFRSNGPVPPADIPNVDPEALPGQ